jgi:integrase
MATLNLTLDTRRARKDGTYPLVFRVRVEDKFCDIGTGFKIYKEQFDLKTNSLLNDIESNILLEQLKTHYLKRLRAYTSENLGCNDIKSMKAYLVNKQLVEYTIIEFWKNQIETLKTVGRYGGAKVYHTSLSVISQEIDLNIPFSKLNYKTIVNLESKLFQRGMSTNGIGVYMRSFRAVCNKAIHYDIVSYEWYPFRKYTIRKEKTTPRVISKNELCKFFSLQLEESNSRYRYWNIGKLLFMLRGINITDLLQLKQTNIKNKHIIYKRAKTGKIYSIALTTEIEKVFSTFTANDTLLGLLSNKQIEGNRKKEDIQQCTKVINTHLDKIGEFLGFEEKLTTYVFRYSYANLAKQLGFSKDLIAEALGHEYGNSVTGIYLEQFDNDVIDEMNKKMIIYVMS